MTATQPTTRTVWQIDPAHTNVAFAIKHMMIATVRGHFSDVTGSVVTNGTPEGSSVEAEIGVASISTGQEQRDAHLRSADFFDVEKYPKITFVSREIRAAGDDEFTMTGDLTIRGVTHPITLAVTSEGRGRDPWGNEKAGYTATGKFSRAAYGLEWNQALETGGVLVGDDVKITLDVELTHQAK
jgi:polyisoprenoid-binding protein YceI